MTFTALQRANSISALATTVVITLLAFISITTFIIPANVDAASLKITSLKVVYGRSNQERYAKEREFVFVKFDLVADLTPLFNWNTKQVFAYIVADYATATHPVNSVVVWDRIVRSSKYAKINIAGGKQKYEFKEIANSFKNVSATFSLQYDVMPHVGLLTHGEATRTDKMGLPPLQRRVEK